MVMRKFAETLQPHSALSVTKLQNLCKLVEDVDVQYTAVTDQCYGMVHGDK